MEDILINNQIPETDQWKLHSNCEKCRRATYCNKPCTTKKKRSAREMRNLVNAIIDATAPAPFIAENAKKWL